MLKAQKYDNPRIESTNISDAYNGKVCWSPIKSIFSSLMYLGFVIAIFYFPSRDGFLIYITTCAIILCFGHSLGMHRKLIHGSYDCPLWLEYVFVYLGTLTGLGGPFTMTQTHDMRDWAQRQKRCHNYFGHKESMLKDWWWQIHCDLKLKNSPNFLFEKKISKNKFYIFIENTSILQQLIPTVLLYFIGGVEYVVWGVCARVATCITGHWLIGYFAHNKGEQHHVVQGASIQGYNVKFCSLITFGESLHNNHHAFPGSAKLSIYPGQLDPGYWVLNILKKIKLISNIKLSHNLPSRPELLKL
jgi:stearoyl-CoA desaturase (delta-9 desaturase)